MTEKTIHSLVLPRKENISGFFLHFPSSLTLTECGWETVETERVMFAPQNLKTVFFSFATDAPCSSVAVYF